MSESTMELLPEENTARIIVEVHVHVHGAGIDATVATAPEGQAQPHGAELEREEAVERELARFARMRPDAPVTEVAEGMYDQGYTPYPPPPRPHYIRWVYVGRGGNVTLYQHADNLNVDSRAQEAFALSLPGAVPMGRKVRYYFRNEADTPEVIAAAESLRRRADERH